jgi:hypothetical protein
MALGSGSLLTEEQRKKMLGRQLPGHSTTAPGRAGAIAMQPLSPEQMSSLKTQIANLVASVNGLTPSIMLGTINKMNNLQPNQKQEYNEKVNSYFAELKKRATNYGQMGPTFQYANEHVAYVSPSQLNNDVNVLAPLNNLYMLISQLNSTGTNTALNSSRYNLTRFAYSKVEAIDKFINSIMNPSAQAKTADLLSLKNLVKVAAKMEKKYRI